jgi:CspA family cold shock protein
MFQVKWFNKRKGYGFVSGDLFVHHSDIQVSGYKYLKRGEYVMGEVTETGGKKKLSNIRAPMEGGKLMCEVDLEDGLVRLDRSASGPDGDVDGAEVREVVSGSDCVVREVGSAPVDSLVRPLRQDSAPVRAVRGGRGPNRGRRVSP